MLRAGAVPDVAGAEVEAVGTPSHLKGEHGRVSRRLWVPVPMGKEALSSEKNTDAAARFQNQI